MKFEGMFPSLHVSHVTCHMSYLMCHMSCVTQPVSHVTFFLQQSCGVGLNPSSFKCAYFFLHKALLSMSESKILM